MTVWLKLVRFSASNSSPSNVSASLLMVTVTVVDVLPAVMVPEVA